MFQSVKEQNICCVYLKNTQMLNCASVYLKVSLNYTTP